MHVTCMCMCLAIPPHLTNIPPLTTPAASRIVSLYPLVHLQALTDLDLGGLELTGIPAHLPPTLRRLALAHNHLQDLDALVGLTRLVELDVRHNQLGDLSGLLSVLSQCPLERLDLRWGGAGRLRVSCYFCPRHSLSTHSHHVNTHAHIHSPHSNNAIPETCISRQPTSDAEVVKRLCYRSLFIYSLKRLLLLDAVPISPLDRRLSKTYLLKVRRCKLRQ